MFQKRKSGKLLKHLAFALLLLVLAACSQQPTPEPGTPDPSPPATPTGLNAVAGNAQVALSWTANSEADLAYYLVFQGTARGDLLDVAEVPKGTESYVASDLANGVPHYFALRAVNVAGQRSQLSEDATATPSADAASTCIFNDSASLFDACTFGN